MKKFNYSKIAKDLKISHSAVSQWFSNKTTPTIEKAFRMEDLYGIPVSAWRDIKSFISKDDYSGKESFKSTTSSCDGVA